MGAAVPRLVLTCRAGVVARRHFLGPGRRFSVRSIPDVFDRPGPRRGREGHPGRGRRRRRPDGPLDRDEHRDPAGRDRGPGAGVRRRPVASESHRHGLSRTHARSRASASGSDRGSVAWRAGQPAHRYVSRRRHRELDDAVIARWLTEPVPLGRVAAFRTLAYLFVVGDLTVFTPWIRGHANTPGDLYRPLRVGRMLHLPVPDAALVHGVFWALLIAALAAATGRMPRLLGVLVFLLYSEWMVIGMSYGKVDHDRFGFLVALAVLPTVGAARHGDQQKSEAAGWALRVTQIAVVCTYLLAAFAKLRFGGIDWPTSSVLAQAIIRRGTPLADLIAGVPGLLVISQFGIIAFELASPLIFFVPARWRPWAIGFFYSFHVATFATITISFAPHLVAMASFLPLEKLRRIRIRRGATDPEHSAATSKPLSRPA